MANAGSLAGRRSDVTLTQTQGGITAPAGFKTAGVHCGIKASPSALDLAVLATDAPASAAALFTTNLAKAAPVLVSREYLEQSHGIARAVVVNSGCANACTGDAGTRPCPPNGRRDRRRRGLPSRTGARGEHRRHRSRAEDRPGGYGDPRGRCRDDRDGGSDAARAIMTTDPFPKECAVIVQTPRGAFSIGGMAKGSG